MSRENSPAVRVLIVEDEALIRWSLSQVLTAAGATVVEATDARTAIDRVRACRDFDVAVLDIWLPDCSDLGLIGLLREALPATRVIVMTAFATPDLRDQAHAIGVAHMVDKPFDLDEMAALVLGPAASR
jgi:DNA-binding NtrC family response regulator